MRKSTLLLFLVSIFISCSNEQEGFALTVGKKYPIRNWPDSTFIANLDSIAAAEPVANNGVKQPEVSVSPFSKPLVPGLKKDTISPSASQIPKTEVTNGSFQESFFDLIDKIQADPSQKKWIKKYPIRNEDNLESILLRVYGKKAKDLPLVLARTQIESINGKSWTELLGAGELQLPNPAILP